jgi:hypothetical protein
MLEKPTVPEGAGATWQDFLAARRRFLAARAAEAALARIEVSWDTPRVRASAGGAAPPTSHGAP